MGKTNKELAIEAFENNDALEKVYVSKDGQPFAVISDAQNYTSKFKKPEDKKLETFTRTELKVKRSKIDRNRVVDAINALKKADSVEAVNKLTEKEIRPFVLAQAKIRLKQLNPGGASSDGSNSELETLKSENAQLKTDLKTADTKSKEDLKGVKDQLKTANADLKVAKKEVTDAVKEKNTVEAELKKIKGAQVNPEEKK